MKTTIYRSSAWLALIAGALMAPAPLPSQQTQQVAPRTHVVRAGETLWSLAERYLGDGHRWREIQQLNPEIITAPQQLPVGATITLPGVRTAPAAPAAPAPRALPPQAVSPPPTSQPVRDTASAAAAAALDDAALLRERTLFYSPQGGTAALVGDTSALAAAADSMVPPRAVRPFEVLAAPFVADPAQLATAGRCVATAVAGESRDDAARRRLRLREIVGLRPPRGVAPDTTTRFLLVRDGPVLDAVGLVVWPTGVVRVIRTTPAVEAEVVAQVDVMSCSDRVLALELPAVPSDARPVAVPDGASGRVLWVEGDALLPTLQHRVIVDLGHGSGIRAGDQLTIFLDDGAVAGPRDAAIATVVRVGVRASSALIIRQSRPGIAAGMRARVTAKLP